MSLMLASLVVAAQIAAAAPLPAAAAPVGASQSAVSASPTAPVEIVLFSDFQCPFCARFAGAFRELQTKGIDGVPTTVTFRNFPLGIHPKAQLAHQAALAAGEQGKFWEMHDLLFANPRQAQRDDLIGYARSLGLDLRRFEHDLDSDALKRRIDTDKADGVKRGVGGTPTFFVNGTSYVGGRSFDQLKQIVQGQQAHARALTEIGEAPFGRGSDAAAVTVELFADLQSALSKPAVKAVMDLLARYPADVRVQFRNFPLAFHAQAALAHEAAVAAAASGRFWEFVGGVLDQPDALGEHDLIALAGRLGLDEAAFAAALREHRYAPRVDVDVQAGLRTGLRGSPAVFVNGKRIDGVPSPHGLAESVETARAAQRAIDQTGKR